MTTHDDLKVIAMPARDEMQRRLETVIDAPHAKEHFIPRLLQGAERELVGPEVVTMIQLAIYDYSCGDPLMGSLMQFYVEDLVDALVDDDTVKQDALDFIERVKAKRQEELDRRPPVPMRPELSDDEKRSLMHHIKQLAAIFDEYTNDPYNSSQGHRVGGVNPFYNQTINGLYLEFYYGTVSKVWTPWGHWHFAAAQSYETDLVGFMSRLTVREHIPEHNTQMGVIGPVYAVLAIDGDDLPEPVLPTDKRQYLEYEDARAQWEQFYGNDN